MCAYIIPVYQSISLSIFKRLKHSNYWFRILFLQLTNCCCCLITQSSPALWDAMDCSTQASLSLTISWGLPKFMFIASMMPSSHLILWLLLLHLPSIFPASGICPMSQLFPSGDQNTGALASASVLPMNIQAWFRLRLTRLISLLSKGLSGVLSGTTVWRHQFFGILPSLQSSFHTCMWPLGRP